MKNNSIGNNNVRQFLWSLRYENIIFIYLHIGTKCTTFFYVRKNIVWWL